MNYGKPPDPFEPVREGEYEHNGIMTTDKLQLIKLSERVNHPSHYNQGKFEVIDVIRDWGLDFSEGNVVKYVVRSRHKDDRLEDLKKARWYLDYIIKSLEDNQE